MKQIKSLKNKQPQLTQMENLSSPIFIEEIEFIGKNFPNEGNSKSIWFH